VTTADDTKGPMTSEPMRSVPDPQSPRPDQSAARPPGDRQPGETWVGGADATPAAFGYLGAIFLGPVIPLIVYAIAARRSPFLRWHTATAVNLSLSGLLYGLCCAILGGLLALDSIAVAIIIAAPLCLGVWLITVRYLLRGAAAANRGERYDIPSWICARIVT
jgi:uncharacterized Tic20 family protein